jgi:hypothetical protein
VPVVWTYSDWTISATYPDGSVAKRDRLELHIKEVSDFISTGNFSVENKSHDKDRLVDYLDGLKRDLEALKAAVASTTGTRTNWTRGKAAN